MIHANISKIVQTTPSAASRRPEKSRCDTMEIERDPEGASEGRVTEGAIAQLLTLHLRRRKAAFGGGKPFRGRQIPDRAAQT
eukprot:scaffold536_cov250-Pinguiococcus_pyrenoidosus.AAC.17